MYKLYYFIIRLVLLSAVFETVSSPSSKRVFHKEYPLAFNLIHTLGDSSHFPKSGKYQLKNSETSTYYHDGGYIIRPIRGPDSCVTTTCKKYCLEETDGEYVKCYEGYNEVEDEPPTVFMNCLPGGPQTCTDADYVPYDPFVVSHTTDFKIQSVTEVPKTEKDEIETSNLNRTLALKIVIVVAFCLLIIILACLLLYCCLPKKVWEMVWTWFRTCFTILCKRRNQQENDGLSKSEPFLNPNCDPDSLIQESQSLQDSTSDPIDKNEWDDFVAFVKQLLEEHPIPQADAVMALKLGSSIHTHYESWQYQPMNITKPLSLKVSYLLSYWKQNTNPSSMKAMVMALDDKLQSESSFNMMREQIKQRFL